MSKVIFLSRGLTRESRHWGSFLEHLQRSLLDFEIKCLDLAGFGEKYRMTSPRSIGEITKELVGSGVFESYKDYDEKWILGMSLGGMVTMELSQVLPDFFDGFILLNTSQSYKTSPLERLNIKYAPELFLSYVIDDVEKRERTIFAKTINSEESNEDAIQEWIAYYQEKPFSKASFLNQTFAGSIFSVKSYIDELKKENGLILSSNADRLVNNKASQTLSELLEWPHITHDKAGHDLSYDDPLWLCGRVKDFVSKK